MARTLNQTSFLKELSQELVQIWRSIRYSLARGRIAFRNRLRLYRHIKLDYIAIPVGGPLPERTGPPRSFLQRRLPLPSESMSLETLNNRLSRIIDAENVKGVILLFQGFSGGIAKLTTLRNAIERLKTAGKECIVFTPYLDTRHYYVASAADRIVCPPSVTFDTLGLSMEPVFLNEALTKLGIEVEIFQVSPYKSAYDILGKSDISPELKEQLEWLLDESFSIIVDGIAAGRQLQPDEVRDLIDSAPFSAQQALDAGLIDQLAYEDELSIWLGKGELSEDQGGTITEAESQNEASGLTRATIVTWPRAQAMLLEKWRRPTKSYVGVLSLEGQIMMGDSRRSPINLPLPIPLFGSNLIGEASVLRLLRRIERDKRMAALVLHIDSGGGSPLASDLISRQLKRIGQKIPVVVYMGDVTASGGYYIAAVASHIVAQPATLTGSIGVVALHLNLTTLYNKVHVNRVSLSRGKRAALYSEIREISEEDRQVMHKQMSELYSSFKRLIADNRDIAYDELEPLCGGRVWSGRQAKEKGLLDNLGNIETAIDLAADLAELSRDDGHYIVTRNLYETSSMYALPTTYEPVKELANLLNHEMLRENSGRPLLILPYKLKYR